MDRVQKAKELFSSGYNCAQAVVLTYADKLDIDEETLKNISAPFGGGIGRLREVCGSVSGAMMVIGLALKKDTLVREDKMQLYAIEQDFASRFKEKTGSIVCRELLEKNPHDDVHNSHKPACRDLVGLSVQILEDMHIIGE